MPKEKLTSPIAMPQNYKMNIANVPPGTCTGFLVLANIGAAGRIYLKYGCDSNDPISDTDYDDFLDVGEKRFIDKPPSGAVLGYCTVAQAAPNLVRQNSWDMS